MWDAVKRARCVTCGREGAVWDAEKRAAVVCTAGKRPHACAQAPTAPKLRRLPKIRPPRHSAYHGVTRLWHVFWCLADLAGGWGGAARGRGMVKLRGGAPGSDTLDDGPRATKPLLRGHARDHGPHTP